MAWPPATNSAFIKEGVTSIKWGTDEMITGNPNSLDGSYWIKTMRAVDKFETIPIENGTGLVSARVGLIQGRQWEITVIDDTSFPVPTYGTAVTLIDPISGNSHTGTIIESSYNAARKQEGERVLLVVFDTNIEGGGDIP